MTQTVSELTLPYLDTTGLERVDAMAAIEEARAQHWLARSDMGYTVIGLSDVTAILRDKRFHSALSMITQIEGVDESDFPQGRRQSILSMEGDGHARLRRLVAPAFTPASANRLRPTMRNVVNGLVDQIDRQRRVRAGRRRLRALPHPDHLRAPGRPAGRLEALLGLGHRHLPHLQCQPPRGSAPHRTSGRRARCLRPRHDRGAPHRPPRRSAQRHDRHRGGRRPPLDRGDGHAGRGRAHGRHRHHPQPAGLLGGPLQRASRPMGPPRQAARAGPSCRRGVDAIPRRRPRHGPLRLGGRRLSRRPLPDGHAGLHLARRGQPGPRGVGTARGRSTSPRNAARPR